VGSGIGERDRRSGKRHTQPGSGCRNVDGRAAHHSGNDVDRVDAGERKCFREVRAREHEDSAVADAGSNPGEQRHEPERDVAEPAIPREHELAPAVARRGTQDAIELGPPHAVGDHA
jgi:hypothetical protein